MSERANVMEWLEEEAGRARDTGYLHTATYLEECLAILREDASLMRVAMTHLENEFGEGSLLSDVPVLRTIAQLAKAIR